MTKRDLNCDILRIIAFLLVIAVHAFGFIGLYETITKDTTVLILHIGRTLIMTCVPIFIILSGYLTKEPKFNKAYVLKLGKIILTYILCAIACLVALHFLEHREVLTLRGYIFSILSFEAAPYAWYVNMYIGLYLLIPFLNSLWNSLSTKKSKQNLILVLCVLFIFPTIFNIYNFDSLNWWLHPSTSNNFATIFPNYWYGNCYPILYYFIGRYLKEYKLNIKLKTNIILLIFSMILFGSYNFYRNYSNYFAWTIFSSYPSLEVLIVTILFVNLVLKYKEFHLKNTKIVKLINKISVLTFGGYLLSRIFDIWLFPYLVNNTTYIKERIIYLIPMILCIGILSLISAYLIDIIAKILIKIFNYLKKKFIKPNMNI